MSIFNRKSPRLKGFDYASNQYYFVTVCTKDKECIFGQPNQLNAYGKIVDHHIRLLSHRYSEIIVDKYVVMPNHIHLIVALKSDGVNEKNTVSLNQVMGLLKSGVTREIHIIKPLMHVWQRSFYDHIIRNQREYEKIWLYIESNPQNWSKDCFYENNAGKYFDIIEKGNL